MNKYNRKKFRKYDKNIRTVPLEHDLFQSIIKIGDTSGKSFNTIQYIASKLDRYCDLDIINLTVCIHDALTSDSTSKEFIILLNYLVYNQQFSDNIIVLLELIQNAIMCLPRKHSYYTSLFVYILSSAMTTTDFKIEFLAQLAEIPQSTNIKNIKGELVQNNDNMKIVFPNLVFYTLVIYKIINNLIKEVDKIISESDNAQNAYKLDCIFAFFIDLCVVQLMNLNFVLELIITIIRKSSNNLQCQIYVAKNLLMISKTLYNKEKNKIDNIIESLAELVNNEMNNYDENTKSYAITFISALYLHKKNMFGNTNIVRLYESAKLSSHLKSFSIDYECDITNNQNIFNDLFLTFKYLKTYNSPVVLPAPLYKHPKSTICYNHAFYTKHYFISVDYIAANLDVAEMILPDQLICRNYINNTLIAFANNYELCAEQLLFIPIIHDCYLYILVDQLFTFFFTGATPPFSGIGFSLSFSGINIANIIRSLIILQSSIKPLICEALSVLLSKAHNLSYTNLKTAIQFIVCIYNKDSHDVDKLIKIINDHMELVIQTNTLTANSKITNVFDAYLEEQDTTSSFFTTFYYFIIKKLSLTASEEVLQNLPDAGKQLLSLCNNNIIYSFDFNFDKYDSISEHERTKIIDSIKEFEFNRECLPIEVNIIKKLLKLRINNQWEQKKLVNELISFLKELEGKSIIKSTTFSNVEELVFPPIIGGKRINDTTTTQKIKKHQTVVKTDYTVIDEEDMEEDLYDNAAQFQTMGIEDLELKHSLVMPKLEFFTDSDSVWNVETISYLISYSFLAVCSKTLAHFFKLSELYVGSLLAWKSISHSHSAELESSILQCIKQLYFDSTIKVEIILVHFLNRGVLSIHSVLQLVQKHMNTFFYLTCIDRLLECLLRIGLIGLPDYIDSVAATVGSIDHLNEIQIKQEEALNNENNIESREYQQGYMHFKFDDKSEKIQQYLPLLMQIFESDKSSFGSKRLEYIIYLSTFL